MAELTKERLQQIVHAAGLEPCDYEEVFDSITTGEIFMMARQLLASMEQEPIYQVQHGDQWRDLNKAQYDDHVNLGADGLRIVYAAPQLPQQAVPDAISTRQAISKMEECEPCDSINVAYKYGWNACRAAMLQGAEPAQGWIPCSKRVPDTMISVLVTGDWFRHAVSFWDGASWCDLYFEPPVTHWMPLPAAPQREVNK